MAGPNPTQSPHLAQLRARAQHHLTEIEADKAREQAQFSQAEADIQRYSKKRSTSSQSQSHTTKSTSRSRSSPQPDAQKQPSSTNSEDNPASNATDEDAKHTRLRPFPAILHRLRWDPSLNISHYTVGYLERFEGIKEMPAQNWTQDSSDEEWIPMHRVRYLKQVKQRILGGDGVDRVDEEPELRVVWDRDGRVDKFSMKRSEAGGEDGGRGEEDVLSLDGTSVSGGVVVAA